MRKYELLSIIKPNMDAEEADIQNFRDGHYVAQKLELAPEKVAEFKRQLSLNDNILRTMFMEQSKVSA